MVDINDERLQLKKDSIAETKAYEESSWSRMSRGLLDIEAEIQSFMRKYATNDHITVAEARKALTEAEIGTWKHTLDEWERMAKSGAYTQEMNREYYASRISRAKALQGQFELIMSGIAAEEDAKLKDNLAESYVETYYRTIYAQQKLATFSSNFARINPREVKAVIEAQRNGYTLSERVWGNLVKDLPQTLTDSLMRGITLGATTDSLVKRARTIYDNTSTYQWHRLINTERARITEQATLAGYKASGLVEEYEYLATLEIKTCQHCAALDGQKFNINDAKEGINYPPLHPNCRCTTVTVDDFDSSTERWAQGIDGREYLVEDMSFPDWYDAYIKPEFKVDNLTYADLNRARDQWLDARKILGPKAPQKLADFVDLKYNNSEGFRRLQDAKFIQNNFNSGKWLDAVNPEKKYRHSEGNEKPGKSYFLAEIDPAELYEKYKQTGFLREDRGGKRIELIDLPNDGKIYGYDAYTGNPINGFAIHYSRTGVHLVPNYHKPKEED